WLLSSLAAWIANPGQGVYSTANAALEGLARVSPRVRALALGPIAGVGATARLSSAQLDALEQGGVSPMKEAEVLHALDAFAGGTETVLAVALAEAARLREASVAAGAPPESGSATVVHGLH